MAIKWNEGRLALDGGPRPDYAGAVLGTTGRDVRVMSDVWDWVTFARVWDGATVIEIPFAYADHATYAEVTVDATPEVLAAVAASEADLAAKAEAARKTDAVNRMVREAERVTTGKVVRVVKGRKVPVGTEGRVFWLGDGKWGTRVGIDANGVTHWTAAGNVEVVNPDEHMDVDAAMALLAA